MTFDALTAHAIADELRDRITGAHVDNVVLLDLRSVALELYAGRRLTLVFAMDPADPRIYLTSRRMRRGTDAVTPFLLLLRKYVRSSRIVAITQPRLERVLTFRLATHPLHGNQEVILVAEAIGRRTNLILLDEDETVMDALVRLPTPAPAGRIIVPHVRYTPPARAAKLDPLDPGLARALEVAATHADGPAWSFLVGRVDGLSPLAAREALARAALESDVAVADVRCWDRVAASLRDLVAPIEHGCWQPCVALDGERAFAFAPYRLQQFPNATVQLLPTMSAAIEQTATPRGATEPRSMLKQPLLDAIGAKIEQLCRKRGSLERALATADRAESLREAGEAILANLSTIEPGAAGFEWNGRRIDLYPSLTPIQNAQAYFREYAAARDARKTVPPLLEEVNVEIEHLAALAVHVELAEREEELAALRAELATAGLHIAERKPGAGSAPRKAGRSSTGGAYRREEIAGAEVLLGRSALGNDTVTFRLARPDDLWFHARGVPGAHVILRTGGKPQPAERIEAVARLAAAHSAARHETKVPVDYTERRHVRRVPGGPPGRVTYRAEATILVSPADA